MITFIITIRRGARAETPGGLRDKLPCRPGLISNENKVSYMLIHEIPL